ncbi:hypothetical protein HDV01_000212 [Terramyces sp. JEL0728]|nr:hypothetical protein HDV01_000212 [Terramyces sp. JEL0728]
MQSQFTKKIIDFEALASTLNVNATSRELSAHLDKISITYRDEFHIPKVGAITRNSLHPLKDQEGVYMCGNSLGLQPKRTRELLNQELDVWQEVGVDGHFDHRLGRPWAKIDDLVNESSAKIVGAKVDEVAIMNSLTVNVHLMMVPFYTPTPKKYKILMEAKAFPSDYFAIESQVKFHGFDPADAIIQLKPREGSLTLETSDILQAIAEHGDQIALVLFSGVQYYTAQYFDIPTITKAGHEKGCIVGWDLAHAAGNIHLKLHEWGVDFACWCSYKYLNSGPGGIGGVFVHEKHKNTVRPRFAGWWGNNPETTFQMNLEFDSIVGTRGYRLSNPSVLTVIALKASLDVFDKTDMKTLVEKSQKMTAYLEFLIDTLLPKDRVEIITCRDYLQRGCQLSLMFPKEGEMDTVFKKLHDDGIICDERRPNVLRIAPTPLYNTYADIYKVVTAMQSHLQ